MNSTWWTNPSELDEDQRNVISLPSDGNYLITGPAGCGKTNLLLLRAAFLHKSGLKNIAVLTFVRSLKEFIRWGSANYPFAEDKIQTYVSWARGVISDSGKPLSSNSTSSFEELRESIKNGLSEAVSNGSTSNSYDSILIDEAQDYSLEELNLIRQFTPRLFLVGDSQQRIQSIDGKNLNGIAEHGFERRSLKFHYRNGLKVCRVADGIQNVLDTEESMEASSQYDEITFPSLVRSFGGKSVSEQIAILLEELPAQLEAYPDELIGVVLPTRAEFDEVQKELALSHFEEQVQSISDDNYTISSNKPIVLSTVHSAKGLEFRAMHLLAADKIKKFQLQKKWHTPQ